jgi:hypothetical protein
LSNKEDVSDPAQKKPMPEERLLTEERLPKDIFRSLLVHGKKKKEKRQRKRGRNK